MSNDFLSRWSRRKQAATAAPEAARNPPDPARAEGAPAQTPDLVGEPADAPVLRLPKIEDLTAQSDVTAFLQAGVPAPLRNAALRRMWSLDPAIRDFVGDARDYAWDWNVPGGVPGSDPLSVEEASGGVRELWRSIGGDPSGAESPAIAGVDEPERGEADLGTSPVEGADPAPSAGSTIVANAPATPATAPDPSTPDRDDVPATGLRRHGRARPV